MADVLVKNQETDDDILSGDFCKKHIKVYFYSLSDTVETENGICSQIILNKCKFYVL